MKTLEHTISFPSAVGELLVQYNFTEAEPWYYNPPKPAEVEIINAWFILFGCYRWFDPQGDQELIRKDEKLKQAVYEAHMKKLKREEDAEWADWDAATMADWNKMDEEEQTEGLAELQPEYLDKYKGIHVQYPEGYEPEQYEA